MASYPPKILIHQNERKYLGSFSFILVSEQLFNEHSVFCLGLDVVLIGYDLHRFVW